MAHLRELGLGMLAFSYDERMHRNQRALGDLVGAVRACEANQLPYQVIFTGLGVEEIRDTIRLATEALSLPLDYAVPVMMSKVDLGGAAGSLPGQPHGMEMACATEPDDELSQEFGFCRRAGFHRPSYLHVSPDGAIRTCLYAPRLANFGNLADEDLLDAVNRFPSDPVSRAFQVNSLSACEHRLFRLYAWLYRPIVHPCTACAVLARLIDEEGRFIAKNGYPPRPRHLEEINRRVAAEYNLLASAADGHGNESGGNCGGGR